MKLISYLDGKKTYIVSGATALSGLLPLLDGHHYVAALAFLLSGAFGASIRGAIKKVEKLLKLPAPVDAVINQEVQAVTQGE